MAKFLALFVGEPGAERSVDAATEKAGIEAWGAWAATHAASIGEGGPIGRTKEVSADGTKDIRNNVGAFVIVEAESHAAAARLFEQHPHFTIFPGRAVEVMPVIALPGAS